jgi:hypothetical protein
MGGRRGRFQRAERKIGDQFNLAVPTIATIHCHLSLTPLKAGVSSICRRNGIRRRNDSAVGKKALKSSQKPYDSMQKPINVQPHTTRTTPPRKKADPLWFFLRIKNLSVACGPIVIATPARKRTCRGGGGQRCTVQGRLSRVASIAGVHVHVWLRSKLVVAHISHSEQPFVEEEQDAEKQEEESQAREPHADFCGHSDVNHMVSDTQSAPPLCVQLELN